MRKSLVNHKDRLLGEEIRNNTNFRSFIQTQVDEIADQGEQVRIKQRAP